MADRESAKAGIVNKDEDDPSLERAFSKARSLEHELAGHRHDQAMRDKELGRIGGWIGGERNAPLTVAAIGFGLALIAFVGIHVVVGFGYVEDARAANMVSAADKCLALATLALGYVCGKSS